MKASCNVKLLWPCVWFQISLIPHYHKSSQMERCMITAFRNTHPILKGFVSEFREDRLWLSHMYIAINKDLKLVSWFTHCLRHFYRKKWWTEAAWLRRKWQWLKQLRIKVGWITRLSVAAKHDGKKISLMDLPPWITLWMNETLCFVGGLTREWEMWRLVFSL